MAKPRMDLSAFVGKLLEEQDGGVLRGIAIRNAGVPRRVLPPRRPTERRTARRMVVAVTGSRENRRVGCTAACRRSRDGSVLSSALSALSRTVLAGNKTLDSARRTWYSEVIAKAVPEFSRRPPRSRRCTTNSCRSERLRRCKIDAGWRAVHQRWNTRHTSRYQSDVFGATLCR
jgi:hypothetical protein